MKNKQNKEPTVIDVKALVSEFKENINVLKKLEKEYEKYIKNYKNVKSGEIAIKKLEYQAKLHKIKAEIKAKENYLEYFEEHSYRNLKK